jgi:hypothetical protein
MSLNRKFETAVEKAFSVFKDFVKSATLVHKKQSGFDWDNLELEGPSSANTVIEVIMYEEAKGQSSNENKMNQSVITYKAIVRSRDFTKGLYDQLIVDGDTFFINDYIDHKFIVELNLKRVSR